MASIYYDLIDELKTKLKKKKIDFVTMVNLINNLDYDKIRKIIAIERQIQENDKIIHNLIINQEYNKIFDINDDEREAILRNDKEYDAIHILIAKIVETREKIGEAMENRLNDLLWLNERLVQFGEQPQPSKKQALKMLKKKVFINIYDLVAEKYEKRTTKQKLTEELRDHPERRFPLQIAKKYRVLTCFLTSYRSKA